MTHKEAMLGVRALVREFKKEGNHRGCTLAESALAWYKKLAANMRRTESLSRKLDAHKKTLDSICAQIRKVDKEDLRRIKRLSLQLKKVETKVWKDLERFEHAKGMAAAALAKFESKVLQIGKLVKCVKKESRQKMKK